jgi:hypothetical protein
MTFIRRIDNPDLQRIKSNFLLRDKVNSELSEQIKAEKSNPVLIFSEVSGPGSPGQGALRGLTYPFKLDGSGGLEVTSGYDRVGQQIREVLETYIGERVMRPSTFGVSDMIFDVISESLMAESLKRRVLNNVPVLDQEMLRINVSVNEEGVCRVVAWYSVEGSEARQISTSFRP